MNIEYLDFLAQPNQPTRSLSMSLIGDKNVVLRAIEQLTERLHRMLSDEEKLAWDETPIPVSLASRQAFNERLAELKGGKVAFQTTQLATDCQGTEAIIALHGLAELLAPLGVKRTSNGIVLSNLMTLYYDQHGKITTTTPDANLEGINALEILAGFCAQDFGLVIERNDSLVYLYGSARYEKTPKHVQTGFDYFIGQDFYEWHQRIPAWGGQLVALFKNIYAAFKQQKLDLVSVDLRGRNHYTNGKDIVRRYERDYCVPLLTDQGDVKGMIVFADSIFKNIQDDHQTFGGKYLSIASPLQFHENFHLVMDNNFQHHPFGMRDKTGKLPSPR